MTHITTLTEIKHLEERYPFNEKELEIIVRAHDQLEENHNKDDFLMTLAKALPYAVFFLPEDETKNRVNWIEENILPQGFSSRLMCALTADCFVDYANQGENKSLERLIEGIADTGRRGSQESLRTIYDIMDDDATPQTLVDICICMGISAEALIVPILDRDAVLQRLVDAIPCILSMARSLEEYCKEKKSDLNKRLFVDWAEENFPGLASTLSTFVHNLLFHGHEYPKTRVPYTHPAIYQPSEIFKNNSSPLLLALSFTNTNLGGKWHQLYSSDGEQGRSFNRLEKSLIGYTGPTVTVIRTTSEHVIGAYTTMAWKEQMEFSQDGGSYLFQLEPRLKLYHAQGLEENFAYLHTDTKSTLLSTIEHISPGLAFGGSLDMPRLFIPESFECCHARYFDKTYESGELIPVEELEMFDIATIEIWGVGGEEQINKALRDRDEYWERHENLLTNVRIVHDKSQFAADFESGLIPNTVFDHKRHARGMKDFVVDDEHGGYKIQRE